MARRNLMDGNLGLGIAVALTLLLFNVPYGRLLMYPFSLLSTWFHEMGHGLTAALLGGDFDALVLRPDTSGFAISHFDQGFGTLRRAMVASAGYLGTAVVGMGLLTLRRWPRAIRPTLQALAAALVASGLLVVLRWPADAAGQSFAFWMPLFGLAVVLFWAAALLVVTQRASAAWQSLLFNIIAAQTALNAVLNVRVLFLTDQHSDADTMASLLFVPSTAWAALWMGCAVLLAGLGLYLGNSKAAAGAHPPA